MSSGCKRTNVEVSTLESIFANESASPAGLSLSLSTVSAASTTVSSGSSTTITLQLRDEANNPLTEGGHTVVFSRSSIGGGSTGTFSAVIDNNDGTYTSTFSGVTAGSEIYIYASVNAQLLTSTPPGVTVVPGAPYKLLFTDQPANSYKNVSFSVTPKAGVYDSNDNLVTSATNTVTLSILVNPAGGTLSGASVVAPASGYAQFPGLSINSPGVGYQLQVSAAGLMSASSNTFNIDDTASITISDGPTFNFGTVALGSSSTRFFTITNTSTVATTLTTSVLLLTPFSYNGGMYPGLGGTCSTTLAAAASCTIDVKYTPINIGMMMQTISIDYTSGASTATATRNIQGTGGPMNVVVAPIYSASVADWSYYYRPAAPPGPYTPCDGTENNGRIGVEPNTSLYGCVHSGEARKVVVPIRSNCTGLSINDTLNIFNWKCTVNGSSQVEFRSTGLKQGKGLRDMIVGTIWISNRVNVLDGAQVIAESISTPWWGNTITTAPNAALGVQTLSTPGTVFVLNNSTPMRGYNINADNISFVTLSANELIWDTAGLLATISTIGEVAGPITSANISAGTQKFLWIETNINHGNLNSKYALFLYNIKFSRVHRTSVKNYNASNVGSIKIINSYGLLMDEIQMTDQMYGVYANSTDHLHIKRFQFGKNVSGAPIPAAITFDTVKKFSIVDFIISGMNQASSFGIHLTNSADGAIVNGSLSSINGIGIHLQSTQGTVLSGLTATGISNTAVELTSSSTNNIITHSTLYLNNWTNLYLQNSHANTLTQLLTGNVQGKSIEFDAANYNSLYNIVALESSNEIYASSTSDFTRTGGTFIVPSGALGCGSYFTEGINSACSAKADTYGTHTLLSTATLLKTSSFRGHVSDTANTSDNGSGVASFTALNSLITSWFTFENIYRTWVAASGTFGDPIQRSACVSGNCQIADLSLKSNDTLVRNTSVNYAGNPPFPTESTTCNSRFNSNLYVQELVGAIIPAGAVEINADGVGNNNSTCETGEYCQVPRSYVLHATEIMGDDIGNENALCEPGEACVFSPNFGAYQGHGSYGISCTITMAPFLNTKIYNYTANGY